MEIELAKLEQELRYEREARARAETELEAIRRLLEEERERCNRIQSEASERQREAVLVQQISFRQLAEVEASAREAAAAAAKAQEEIAETSEKASAAEIELEASRKALDEERERCRRFESKASEKLEEAVLARKRSLKKLECERLARAYAEASMRNAAYKWGYAEGELEKTSQILDKTREQSKRIQSEASNRKKELLRSLENDIKELNDETKISESLRQSGLTIQKLVAAEAELEATRQILGIELTQKDKEAALAKRRTALEKQLKPQVDVAPTPLPTPWDTDTE